MMRVRSLGLVLFLVTFVTACVATNPVTGKRGISLMSMSDQVALGESKYKPYQQQQGGVYVVDPDINFYLKEVGKRLAAVSDQPNLPYDFVLLNNDAPNAWALPGGKIAINRGLLVMLEDEAQLAAVLGHEIVHAAAGHSAQQHTRTQFLKIGTSALSILTEQSEYGGLLTQGAMLGAGAFNAKYGRDDELESDEFGIKYMVKAGYNPQAAVELQQKFVELSKGRQQDMMSALFASHPPSQQRVERNKTLAANQQGKRNKGTFEKAIAQLRKDQPAYQNHLKAIKAANDKQFDNALSLVRKAIKHQPAEALFYVTEGQLLKAKKDNKAALNSFTKATKNNPSYVMGHLQRGLTEKQLNKNDAAISSLQKSMNLLATPIAGYHLGELMLGKSRVEDAKRYFNFAAQDSGEIGQAAKAQLAKLTPSATAP